MFNKAGGSTSLTLSAANQGFHLCYDSSAGIWTDLADALPVSYLNTLYVQSVTAADSTIVVGGTAAAPTIKAGSRFLCTPASYAPGTQTALAVSSATLAAVSSANVSTGTFTAPASGSVIVTVSLTYQNSATSNYTTFGLAAHGTVTPLVCPVNTCQYLTGGKPVDQQMTFLVTGLTSGTSYNLDLVFGTNTGTATVYAYGNTSTTAGTTPGSPVIMTVEAA